MFNNNTKNKLSDPWSGRMNKRIEVKKAKKKIDSCEPFLLTDLLINNLHTGLTSLEIYCFAKGLQH